jgi:hypothetical protein
MIDRIAKWLAASLLETACMVETWRRERRDRLNPRYGVHWAIVCRHCRRAWIAEIEGVEGPPLIPNGLQCPTCLRMAGGPTTDTEWKAALEAMN